MSPAQWLIVALVCGAVEIFTLGFWFLWLALSAVIVAIIGYLGITTSIQIQLLIFAISALLFIIFTRPLLMKFVKSNEKISNFKALVGQHGVSLSEISAIKYGQVKVGGEIWTAVSDEHIEEDSRIIVTGVDGVKLRVKKD